MSSDFSKKNKKNSTTFYLPPDLKEKLKDLTQRMGLKQTVFIELAVYHMVTTSEKERLLAVKKYHEWLYSVDDPEDNSQQ